MTPKQFALWLKGFTDALEGQQPTSQQWQQVRMNILEVFGTDPAVTVHLSDEVEAQLMRGQSS